MSEQKTDTDGYLLDDCGNRVTICGFPVKMTERLPNAPKEPIVLITFKDWMVQLVDEAIRAAELKRRYP